MADGVEFVLQELPAIFNQAERHFHSENLNILEHIRRRLDDSYVAIHALLQHSMEQENCDEVIVLLRVIHDRVLAILERYNELLNCNLEGDNPLELNTGLRFTTEQYSEQGRPRLNVAAEVLNDLHSIHCVWSVVAKQTGVSYRTILRRRQEYGLPISSGVGPRSTYSDISEEQLCNVLREILQLMPDAGETYVIGAIRSRRINVQRWSVRQAIQTVDPIS